MNILRNEYGCLQFPGLNYASVSQPGKPKDVKLTFSKQASFFGGGLSAPLNITGLLCITIIGILAVTLRLQLKIEIMPLKKSGSLDKMMG